MVAFILVCERNGSKWKDVLIEILGEEEWESSFLPGGESKRKG